MQRTLIVSLFRHARDNFPELQETDWAGLFKIIGEHRILAHGDKLDAPALSPTEYARNARRSNDNARAVHFGVLDYDKLSTAEMEHVLTCAEGLATILYTSWSHAERHAASGTWSFRLLVAFSRPVTGEEWPRLWPRLFARMGALADLRCKDLARIYFLPSAPTPEGCIVDAADGNPLDVDVLLSQPEPPPSVLTPRKEIVIGKSDLDGLATRLIRRRNATVKAAGYAIRAALDGQPLADHGNRDNTLYAIACALAEAWPDAAAGALAAHFAPSLGEMAKIAPQCPTVEDLAKKIDRQQIKVRAERDTAELERRQALARKIREAFGNERDYGYNEDELSSFAASAGTDTKGFQRRWIIQAGRSFYLYKAGQYGPPLMAEELIPTAEIELSPADHIGVTVWKFNRDGEPRTRSPQELVMQYGTTAQHVVADLAAQRSYFDLSSRTIVEAPCPVRDLAPRFYEEIDYYLEHLGGPLFPKLMDWIACVTLLREPCAALYLDGAPGSGKTLLADALARLWHKDGPTELSGIVGSFNESLLQCPLVLADEVLPDILKRSEGTGELRQLIQARTIPLKRKYRPQATLRGSVRIILTANNKHLLDTSELLTPEDIAAVAERILYIKATPNSRKVLEEIGPEMVRRFVSDDLLARHALWLRDNRPIIREHRFLVSGVDSALHRSLTTSRGLSSAICQWCVSYLLSPGKMDATNTLHVRVTEGQLLVTARALSEHWDMYQTNVKAPPAGRISRALAALCEPKRQLAAGNGKPTNYWPLKTSNLLTWAEDLGYTLPEEILDALQRETVRS
jgi:hypothetical protein